MRFIPGGREHLHARVGDRLVVGGRVPHRPRRVAEILEVHGEDGSPPYVVRWSDGQEGAVFPGPDAHIEAAAHADADPVDETASESV
jgi:uncharacterized protein DUF1918